MVIGETVNLTPIRDVVQKTRQLDPKKLGRDSFVYVDISSVDKDTKKIVEPQTLLVDAAPSRARKEIKANDVLVATVRPNLNGVAIVPPEHDNQIASTGFCVLRSDTEQLDPNYLFYFTQTETFVSHLTELSTGAGYPAVSDEDILDTRIPLPPLTEQKRIASLLARADRLRALRRTAHELGESLLQSVFLEMFGDVEKNPKRLPEATLEHIASKAKFGIVDGPFGSHLKAEEYTNSGVRVIRVNNIKPNRFNFDDVRFVSQEKYETIKRSTVRPNDIIMAKVGNTIGKTCIFPSEIEYAVLTANVCKITVDPKHANPVFISYQMNFEAIQERIRNLSGDTAKPMINIPRLKELKLLLPPLSLQEEFAGVVARVESLRGRIAEGEAGLP
ncbi:MAG: hypothetical protein FJ010_08630 [Chloroflexi bacterium]|nr:hypothetical protein [Chloroflexota bacterium]